MYQHIHWVDDDDDGYYDDDDDDDQLIVLIKVPAEDAGYGALEQAAVLDVEVNFW